MDNLLPDGYEWAECHFDEYVYHKGLCACSAPQGVYYIAKPKVRKYNWSKTAAHALVEFPNGEVMTHYSRYTTGITLAQDWLYHDGSACPFDMDAVYVDVICREFDRGMKCDPYIFNWDHGTNDDIIAVRFNSLKEGFEF